MTLVKATRSFGAMVKGELYDVEMEAERIGHLVEADFLEVVRFVADHGDQAAEVLGTVAETMPPVSAEATEAQAVVEKATKVAKAVEGK